MRMSEILSRARFRPLTPALIVIVLLLSATGAFALAGAAATTHSVSIAHPGSGRTRRSSPVSGAAISTAFPPREVSAAYSSGEYPMGLADYGQAHLSTSSYDAAATISSLSTEGTGTVGADMSFQLNAVLQFETGGQDYEYWIQDVATVDTATSSVPSFENNIWNFSSSDMCLSSTAVAGDGSVLPYSGCEGYYVYGVASSFTYPGTFQLIVNASTNAAGQPTVRFMYDVGSGFQTFDLVTFPFVSQGVSGLAFIVNSGETTPAGADYDTEFVLGGPGGGSTTANEGSDVDLTLEFWNGDNYQMVYNGENHGEDTAETITNTEVTGEYYTASGSLFAEVTAGTENIDLMWSSSQIAFVDLDGPGACDGTLVSGASSTPYTAGYGSITLWPVSEGFAVSCDGYTLSLGTYDLSAGTTTTLTAGTWADLDFEEGGLVAEATWSVSIASESLAGSGATLGFYVPVGTYAFSISGPATYLPQPSGGQIDVASTGASVTVTWQSVRVTASTSSASVDLGQSVEFSVDLTGASSDAFDWSGLPSGCSGANTSQLQCRPTSAGVSGVVVEVTDANGYGATSAALSFTTFADPMVGPPVASSGSADVGQTVSFRVSTTPGSGGDTLVWMGLPTGCASANSTSLSCVPSSPGDSVLWVTLTDSNGFSATSSDSPFVVFALPTVGPIQMSPTADVQAGQTLNLTVTATPGSGGLQYVWSGLPTGCVSVDSATLSCTPSAAGTWDVTVTVTDSNHGTATSLVAVVTVQPAPAGPSALDGYIVLAAVVVAIAAACAAGAVLVRRRRSKDQQSKGPPPSVIG